MFRLVFLVSLLISIASFVVADDNAIEFASELQKELYDFLVENHQTPENYVISKFKDHDIVFIGEQHRTRHDVELIHTLIPLLYENGVYNLGIEFGNFHDQPLIDSLINADVYDSSLAEQIQFNQWPFWGFREYVDIYYHAWKVNSQLSPGSRKFRVVGLNARSDWSHIWSEEDRRDPEKRKLAFPDGDGDEFMAKIIIDEFIAHDEKALIYCGIHHAFTKYRQPYKDGSTGEIKYVENRAGNIVCREIGEKCMTIFLHWPWSDKEHNGYVYPVNGEIDKLMRLFEGGEQSAGFDVPGTPFEELTCETCLYALGYDNFNLGMFCDGYIYTMPIEEYRGVTAIDGFINEQNRLEAIRQIANPNPRVKDSSRTVESLMQILRNDTDLQDRFNRLLKEY